MTQEPSGAPTTPARREGRLAFLHLSDIHFPEGGEPDVWELDGDLRNELELELATVVASRGSATHVLVTGDVAFSGKEAQYARATRWLERIAELSGCPRTAVGVVPGNHDVDWDRAEHSKTLQLCHDKLRASSPGEIDDVLADLIKDVDGGRLIFAPLENYNAFAFHFRSQITPKAPFWERPFALNDGSILRVRGLTSVLVSDSSDARGRLVMGISQVLMRREAGVAYLTLSHHPPDWLLDHDAIDATLVERAKLQLFGHRHEQRLIRLDDCVRMVAGAVHPQRRENGWLPRFNWIEVAVVQTDAGRSLEVLVFPRAWNAEHKKFVPDYLDGMPYRAYSLPLEPWARPAIVSEDTGSDPEVRMDEVGEVGEPPIAILDPVAEATYRIAELPFHRKVRLFDELSLIEDSDRGLAEMEVLARIIERVESRDLWEAVWDEIDRMTNSRDPNPFRGS